jgi:DNA-binding protein H-NS
MAKRAKTVLAGMDFESLVELRREVEQRLQEYRRTLESQLASMGGTNASLAGGSGRRRASMKGKKVPPKYRGPGGETWAGRGATPRWLKAALKEGKKIEDFLIDKTVGKARVKRRAKK